jgi:hypothetical protein
MRTFGGANLSYASLSPFVPLFLQVDGQVVALLVQNLERLDESVREEADGVHNTLGEWQGARAGLGAPFPSSFIRESTPECFLSFFSQTAFLEMKTCVYISYSCSFGLACS